MKEVKIYDEKDLELLFGNIFSAGGGYEMAIVTRCKCLWGYFCQSSASASYQPQPAGSYCMRGSRKVFQRGPTLRTFFVLFFFSFFFKLRSGSK